MRRPLLAVSSDAASRPEILPSRSGTLFFRHSGGGREFGNHGGVLLVFSFLIVPSSAPSSGKVHIVVGDSVVCRHSRERCWSRGFVCPRSTDWGSDGAGVRTFSCACRPHQSIRVRRSQATMGEPAERSPCGDGTGTHAWLCIESLANLQSHGRSTACGSIRRGHGLGPAYFSARASATSTKHATRIRCAFRGSRPTHAEKAARFLKGAIVG